MTAVPMPCARCDLPGYPTGAELLCATHGAVPDAAAVEALVTAGGTQPLPGGAPRSSGDTRPVAGGAPPSPSGSSSLGLADGTSLWPVAGGGSLWPVVTGAFIAAGLAHAALQAYSIWALRRADAALHDPATTPPLDDAFRTAADAVSLARTGLWSYLACFLLWLLLTGATATRLGLDRRAALRHWTILVWRIALVPTLTLAILNDHLSPTWPAAHAALAFAVFHLLTTALLLTYTTVVRRRLRPFFPGPS
ncbi:hypothetical protein ACQEVZ_53475 [Dactylosporangium sp. CA-152071]|uniref:hypothetical protein n=1 Tax=Dactylosporangium sp. CA-152071 TaxID=3239933 RepID=UPI003D923871